MPFIVLGFSLHSCTNSVLWLQRINDLLTYLHNDISIHITLNMVCYTHHHNNQGCIPTCTSHYTLCLSQEVVTVSSTSTILKLQALLTRRIIVPPVNACETEARIFFKLTPFLGWNQRERVATDMFHPIPTQKLKPQTSTNVQTCYTTTIKLFFL